MAFASDLWFLGTADWRRSPFSFLFAGYSNIFYLCSCEYYMFTTLLGMLPKAFLKKSLGFSDPRTAPCGSLKGWMCSVRSCAFYCDCHKKNRKSANFSYLCSCEHHRYNHYVSIRSWAVWHLTICAEPLGLSSVNGTPRAWNIVMCDVRSCAFFVFMRTSHIVRVPTQTRRKASRRRFPPCNLPIRFRFHPSD